MLAEEMTTISNGMTAPTETPVLNGRSASLMPVNSPCVHTFSRRLR